MVYVYLVFFYLFFVWILLRLFVPHLGFWRKPIPKQIPHYLEVIINEYSKTSETDFEFFERSYKYVTQRYTGNRIKTLTEWKKAFADVYTQSPGFLPCTGQNYLLRTMLIKSGRFVESDIKIKVVPLNFFIHQYLLVTVDGTEISADPWSHFLGKKVGEASIFIG